ncbi:hypothetical protein [Tardiphaga sp.]|jgi:hypothetical protein|uniref:hypothetical protein n=1 Tax=Tardiphaga sp. TaxID=1926292 RepID=UPI0037D9CD3C
MSDHHVSKALQFVEAAPLPPLPGREAAPEAPAKDTLSDIKDQAAIVGSDVISFVSGVTAEQRQDLINSVLLAQLVAKVKVPDSARIYDWYKEYFEVLKQIGWVVQSEQFATYIREGIGFEAHEAIIELATSLLGPASGALAVVKATLGSLQKMKSDSPWITIFNRESQSGQTARFQVSVAEPDQKGGFFVTLMAFGLEAHATLTQVLVFKIHSNKDTLRHFEGKVSINARVLAGIREEVEKKLAAHVASYVRTLPDLGALPKP